jgi:hypothetical protein
MRQSNREPIYPRDTLFKAVPQPNGSKVRFATDSHTGDTEETYMNPLAGPKLRTKAIQRRKRVY